MRPDSHYDSWKRRRREAEVPAGFADRVMGSLHQVQAEQRLSGFALFWSALLASRAAMVGLCTAGCLVCAFRMLSLVALFFPR